MIIAVLIETQAVATICQKKIYASMGFEPMTSALMVQML